MLAQRPEAAVAGSAAVGDSDRMVQIAASGRDPASRRAAGLVPSADPPLHRRVGEPSLRILLRRTRPSLGQALKQQLTGVGVENLKPPLIPGMVFDPLPGDVRADRPEPA